MDAGSMGARVRPPTSRLGARASRSGNGKARRPAASASKAMSANSPSASSTAGAARGDEVNNVDKIRDILFGNQMRDYDAKFARLEERLQAEAAELRVE